MTWIWLKRFFFSSRKTLLKFKVLLSLVGLVIGVSSLTVTMIVMSSYDSTLRKSLIGFTGHLLVTSSNREGENKQDMLNAISPLIPPVAQYTSFISTRALALSEGEVSGILLEGIDLDSIDKVLDIQSRFVKGRQIQSFSEAVIGIQLAKRLNLKVGSLFSIAVSELSREGNERPFPKVKEFIVSGIVDLGHYNFNSRYVAISIDVAQNLIGYENHRVMGLRFLFKKGYKINQQQMGNIQRQLSPFYWVQDWKGHNRNLFIAIETEKRIIFFVLLILIIVAGFNISNQLFVDVLRRFRDISILKVMGASPFFISRIFVIETLIVSTVGTVLGILFGICICYGIFAWFDLWKLIVPVDLYKLNEIILDLKWMDFLIIFISSISICLLSCILPVIKALSLVPKDGLSYE